MKRFDHSKKLTETTPSLGEIEKDTKEASNIIDSLDDSIFNKIYNLGKGRRCVIEIRTPTSIIYRPTEASNQSVPPYDTYKYVCMYIHYIQRMAFYEIPEDFTGTLDPKQPVCFVCMKNVVKIKPCSGCRKAFYCSAECQKNDWSEHKLTCKLRK